MFENVGYFSFSFVSSQSALKPGMSFCTKCGTRVGASSSTEEKQSQVVLFVCLFFFFLGKDFVEG